MAKLKLKVSFVAHYSSMSQDNNIFALHLVTFLDLFNIHLHLQSASFLPSFDLLQPHTWSLVGVPLEG